MKHNRTPALVQMTIRVTAELRDKILAESAKTGRKIQAIVADKLSR